MAAAVEARKQTPEYKAAANAYAKAYSQTPVRKAYVKAYQQTPEYKAYQKAYHQTAERKAERKADRQRSQAKQPVAKRARTTTASVEVRQPATAVSIMAGLQASRPSHGEWEARTG